MRLTIKADLYLLLITIIWGATFPLIRNAVAYIDPYLFVTVRFTLASVLMLLIILPLLKQTSFKIIARSLILGVLNSIAYLAQTIGLQTTTASRSAFITGFCVVLVPFLAPLFRLGKLGILDIVCSIISLVGLYILTGADLHHINIGDKWTFFCALAFALQITAIHYFSTRIKEHQLLAFYQLVLTIPLSFLFSLHSNTTTLLYPKVMLALAFCAIFATAFAFSIQAKYQQFTTATQAVLIFSLEPVFAAIISIVFYHEILTKTEVIGAGFILLSLLLPTLLRLKKL